MFNDERIEQAKRAAALSGIEAAKNAALDLPELLRSEIPDCFGDKWKCTVARIKKRLDCDAPLDIYAYATKSYAYAKSHASTFLKEITGNPNGWANGNLCTPEGYADSEGWAWTLYNHLESVESDDVFIEIKTFGQKPTTGRALDAMAVLWFCEAAAQYTKNAICGLDILCEASQAMALADYSDAWNGAAEFERDGSREKSSTAARNAALARHKKHADARDKLISLWKSGQYKTRNECVTTELPDLIKYCGKSIAYKTAREWLVGIEKD
ncbi:hypothetical protein [Flavobacterium sp.]|jgi:hypothetical protein|uniref:hypothetical protein n=1 Tax=Flavobacterium sp. TaxID=239 RepID=UPI0037BE4DA8